MSFLNKLTFHNAKKLVSSTTAPSDHPTEAADPGFEAAVAEFNTYHDSLFTIDQSMSEYAKQFYALFNGSVSIIDAMAHAISNNDAATLRNTFANTRDAHSILTSDREATISADLRANCLKPLQDELTLHAKLQQAIKQRSDLAKEVDYYSGKMDSLLTEKQKTEAKGKVADMEKVERNQKKKDEAASMYTVVNAEVIAQLQAAVMRKGELLTQVFSSFEHIERQVAETYMAAVSSGGAIPSGSLSSSSSAGVTVGDFTSRMGNMGKHRADGDGDDGGVAISLGMPSYAEGQEEGHGMASTTRSTLTTTTTRSAYRPTTPPPPSYTPSLNQPAPTAASARGKQPGSPQPHPPPPPPPVPAKHL